MTTWIRTAQSGITWGTSKMLLGSIGNGNTYLRTLFGIRGAGFLQPGSTVSETSLQSSLTNALRFGIVTTIGDTTEAVPSPVVNPQDANPPTERWLYFGQATPYLREWVSTFAMSAMDTGPAWENLQSEGQVLATGIPTAQTLNIWLSVDTVYGAWTTPTAGDIAWWNGWASVLCKDLFECYRLCYGDTCKDHCARAQR